MSISQFVRATFNINALDITAFAEHTKIIISANIFSNGILVLCLDHGVKNTLGLWFPHNQT